MVNVNVPWAVLQPRLVLGTSDNSGSPFGGGSGSLVKLIEGEVTTMGLEVVLDWCLQLWRALQRGIR